MSEYLERLDKLIADYTQERNEQKTIEGMTNTNFILMGLYLARQEWEDVNNG